MKRKFLLTDKKGFFINTINKSNVQTAYTPIIENLIINYREIFQTNLHSIYVRGSVASGNATPDYSDVDTFAILNTNCENTQLKILNKKNEKLLIKFPFITRFDCNCISISELFHNPQVIRYQFIIKCLSFCVFGEDISPQIRKFKPNAEIIENLPLLKTRIEKIKNRFTKKIPSYYVRQTCNQIMKSIIRAGFELCIKKESKFTTELNQCYITFSNYYPEKKEKMSEVLNLAINPSEDKVVIIQMLDEMGDWLTNTYNQQSITQHSVF